MKTEEAKAGVKVRYNAKGGSIGEIADIVNRCVYVRWNFGKDVRGEPIRDTSMFLLENITYELVVISEEEYLAHTEKRAWT